MNRRYPWSRLKKPGDSFIWTQMRDEFSLRSQAHKQGKKRAVLYSVRKSVRGATATYFLRVTYVHGVL